MPETQTTAPVQDNAAVVGQPGQEGSALTGNQTAAPDTTSLTEGVATKELPGWMSQLPADLKSDEALAKFPNVWDMAKSYKELEGKLSEAVIPPGETATEEDRAKFYARIGRPEKPEDYKLEQVKLPEGLTIDEEMQKEVREVAHKAGITEAQLNTINQWYFGKVGPQFVAAQKLVKTTQEEADQQLRTDLGADYDVSQTYKDRAFREFGSPDAAILFDKSGLGNAPSVIKMFIKIGKAISEHKFVEGSKGEHLAKGEVGARSDEEIANTMYPPKE